jgi:hypothetical protein
MVFFLLLSIITFQRTTKLKFKNPGFPHKTPQKNGFPLAWSYNTIADFENERLK